MINFETLSRDRVFTLKERFYRQNFGKPRKCKNMNELSVTPCSACTKLIEAEKKHHMMISKISHEIRNPLTLIYSSLQLVEQDVPAVHTSELWMQIKSDILDTITLLKDISSANDENIHIASVNMADFLNEISSSFKAIMKKQGIEFLSDIHPDLADTYAEIDKTKMKEAVTNLLINACDAVKSNKTHPAIYLTAFAQPGEVTLLIKDNGSGIPHEYLDDLFDPFVTHKPNGTGLGLEIARSAALKHGGSLTVDTSTDAAGSYTEFCLKFPQTLGLPS